MKRITTHEIEVGLTDVIVSTTDIKGNITYANDVFVRISGYSRNDLIGKPHNILRHPHMPKAIFKYLWTELLAGRSLYAFVKNRTKNGDYYWVKVYAMPIMRNGVVEKLISYRQHLNSYAKNVANNLYSVLVEYEKNHTVDESLSFLVDFLTQRNLTYNNFIDRLSLQKNVTSLEAMNVDYKKFYNNHLIYKSFIQHTEKELKVESPDTCEFGKWVSSVQHQEYTKSPSWKKMKNAHNNYHLQLEKYNTFKKGTSPPKEFENIIHDVENSTHEIFKHLQDSIDNFN